MTIKTSQKTAKADEENSVKRKTLLKKTKETAKENQKLRYSSKLTAFFAVKYTLKKNDSERKTAYNVIFVISGVTESVQLSKELMILYVITTRFVFMFL